MALQRTFFALSELNLSCLVAQNDKVHPLLVANGIDKSMNSNALPNAMGQIGNGWMA